MNGNTNVLVDEVVDEGENSSDCEPDIDLDAVSDNESDETAGEGLEVVDEDLVSEDTDRESYKVPPTIFNPLRKPSISEDEFLALSRRLVVYKHSAASMVHELVCRGMFDALFEKASDEQCSKDAGVSSKYYDFIIQFGTPSGLHELAVWTERLVNSLELPRLLRFLELPEAEKILSDMCRAHFPLVVSIARWRFRLREGGASLQDLIQEGNFGLVLSVIRFDPERGNKFSTFAMWWIRQHVWRGAVNLRPKQGMLSLDGTLDQFGRDMYEHIADTTEQSSVSLVLSKESAKRVREAVGLLGIQEQLVLNKLFGLAGLEIQPLDQIANELRVGINHVRQIKRRALKRLRRELVPE